MAYLLHFASKEREFTGVDHDDDNVEIANNCFSKDDKINFIFAEISEYTFEKYDAIIMSDFLLNMEQNAQKLLIKKCISHLNPWGRLIVRTDNKDLNTKDISISYQPVRSVEYVASANNMICRVMDQPGNTNKIVFVINTNG